MVLEECLVIPPTGEPEATRMDEKVKTLPKEGKDRHECGSYRPLSVLNQDYKIFTHILAKRIKMILPQIISLDQTD